MNSVAVRQSSRDEPKSKRLGFGYEAKSADSPSVQTARAEFLNIIAGIKPRVVFNLFETCYLPFIEFLQHRELTIESIYEEVEANTPQEPYFLRQPKFMMEKALTIFIPNSLSLAEVEGASQLRQALGDWALKHNLVDSWCQDDALRVLRTFRSLMISSWHFLFCPTVTF